MENDIITWIITIASPRSVEIFRFLGNYKECKNIIEKEREKAENNMGEEFAISELKENAFAIWSEIKNNTGDAVIIKAQPFNVILYIKE